MKRTKVDNTLERELLTALITSKEFLGSAAAALARELPGLRDLPMFTLVSQWCLDYFAQHHKAPSHHVEALYHSWADDAQDKDLADSVHDLLSELSEEPPPEPNVAFLLDQLGEFLTKRKQLALSEDLDALCSRGDTKGVSELVGSYRAVELGGGSGIDVLTDTAAWDRAFKESRAPMMTFPGHAGKFFNPALTRDSLVAIQAPEKRGKTWWLIEFAIRALQHRLRVAYFEAGDLSETQLLLRLGTRITGSPSRVSGDKGSRVARVPMAIKAHDSEDDLQGAVVYKTIRCPKALSKRELRKGLESFAKANGFNLASKRSRFRASCHPNDTLNVRTMDAILDQWNQESGFTPDLIVVDYADIMAPEDSKRDEQEEVNSTWKALRRLSQQRHALVITATQANAASYEAKTQGMKHFSRDKRKLAHVTGMFALNQTPAEKEAQVMRVNWIVLREAEFNVNRCLTVGTCYKRGQACTVGVLLPPVGKD